MPNELCSLIISIPLGIDLNLHVVERFILSKYNHLRMNSVDSDVLDIEVPCYICKDHVMLGNDYRCHLNYAHDIFDDVDKCDDLDQAGKGDDDDLENDKNGIFQCEVCGEAFKGRDVIEAHINSLHLHIVKELEEEVADFYVLLRAVANQGSLVVK